MNEWECQRKVELIIHKLKTNKEKSDRIVFIINGFISSFIYDLGTTTTF